LQNISQQNTIKYKTENFFVLRFCQGHVPTTFMIHWNRDFIFILNYFFSTSVFCCFDPDFIMIMIVFVYILYMDIWMWTRNSSMNEKWKNCFPIIAKNLVMLCSITLWLIEIQYPQSIPYNHNNNIIIILLQRVIIMRALCLAWCIINM
jgi:hypothetical protein